MLKIRGLIVQKMCHGSTLRIILLKIEKKIFW